MGRGSCYLFKTLISACLLYYTDMNAKIRDILIFFAGFEKLKITLHVGCKQLLGGIVPENHDMQMSG